MKFTVPGIPIPQGRARIMRGGWAFDPPKSRAAKNVVAMQAKLALLANRDSILGAGCLNRVSVVIHFYGARKNADLDNLYKLVTDACQDVLYANDSQIDHSECWRLLANKGEERTDVEIKEL